MINQQLHGRLYNQDDPFQFRYRCKTSRNCDGPGLLHQSWSSQKPPGDSWLWCSRQAWGVLSFNDQQPPWKSDEKNTQFVVEVSAKENVVLTCLEIIRMVSLSKWHSELIGQHIPTKVIILSLKKNHNHFSRNATSRWSTILKPQTPGRVIYLESHRFLDFADFDGGGDVTANRWDPKMRVECLLFSKNNDVKLGGGFKYVYFHPNPWGNDPIWLIFFRWVETTN